ncbi:MAG: hypothetical protein ACD_9C00188G0001 [uncultured bacterium]|nr:MAG: hypothetical protein ACD_9C00188G0001 [uncultured bacterium]
MNTFVFKHAFEDAKPYPTVVARDGRRFLFVNRWEFLGSPAEGRIKLFSASRENGEIEILLEEIVAAEKISIEQQEELLDVISEKTMAVKLSQNEIENLREVYNSFVLARRSAAG